MWRYFSTLICCFAAGVQTCVAGTDFVKTAGGVIAAAGKVRAEWPVMRGKLAAGIPAPAADVAPLLLHLTLDNAHLGGPLYVMLVADGRGGMNGVGYMPSLNNAIHPAMADVASVSKSSLKLNLTMVFRSDGVTAADGDPRETLFKLSLTRGGGNQKVSGTHSTRGSTAKEPLQTVIAGEGSVSGWEDRGPGAGSVHPWRDPFAKALRGADPWILHAAAGWHLAAAQLRYQLCRVAALAARKRISISDACAQILPMAPMGEVLLRGKPVKAARGKAKGGKKKPVAPVLDDDLDLGDDLGLGLGGDAPVNKPGKKKTTAKQAPPDPKQLAARGADLEYALLQLKAMQKVLAAWQGAGAKMPVPSGAVDPGDPAFAPWVATEPLSESNGRRNVLNGNVGSAGAQEWRWVTDWRIAGPLPLAAGDDALGDLPPLASLGNSGVFGAFRGFDEWCRGKELKNKSARCVAKDAEEYMGEIKGPAVGEGVAWYASTVVHAAKAVRAWLGIAHSQDLRLFVGNRLAASLAGPPSPHFTRTDMVPVDLEQGGNLLVIRCSGPATREARLFVRAAVRGKPRDAKTVATWENAVKARYEEWEAQPPRAVGFRFDGTAYWPNTRPPTAWDLKKGINVKWHTKLWDRGYASPVVVGNRVFVLVEPHYLVCLNKSDGKVLWERETNALEISVPDLVDESRALVQARRRYQHQQLGLPIDPEWPDKGKVDWGKMSGWHKGKGNEKYKWPRGCVWDGNDNFWVGTTFATPIAADKRIWVLHHSGVAACYSMDGERKWIAGVPLNPAGHPGSRFCASPALSGDTDAGTGRLIILMANGHGKRGYATKDKNGNPIPLRYDDLLALDSATGKEVWKVECRVPLHSASPVVIRLTDGSEDCEVVVVEGGTLVRCLDGKVLARLMPGASGQATPTLYRDRVWRCTDWGGHDGAAFRYFFVNGAVSSAMMWHHKGMPSSGGLAYRDGWLYGTGGMQGGAWYACVDPTDLKPPETPARRGVRGVGIHTPMYSDGYAPAVVGGDYVFAATRGDRKAKLPDTFMSVVQAIPEGRFIAHNTIPAHCQSHVAFDKEHLYIRLPFGVACVGYTGDEGRAYEAMENTRRLFADFRSEPPDENKPVQVGVAKNGKPSKNELKTGVLTRAGDWSYSTPFAADATESLVAAAGVSPVGGTLSAGGQKITLKPIYRNLKDPTVYPDGIGPAINVRAALGSASGKVCLLARTIYSPRAGIMRIVQPNPAMRLWIGGVEVKDGQRVAFPEGVISLVAANRPLDADADAAFYLALGPSDDVDRERREWLTVARQSRLFLEAMAKYYPKHELAAKAKAVLSALGE